MTQKLLGNVGKITRYFINSCKFMLEDETRDYSPLKANSVRASKQGVYYFLSRRILSAIFYQR